MKRTLCYIACGIGLFVFPAMAQDAPERDWLEPVVGQGYGVQVKEARTSDAELKKIKAAGLSYVRFVIPWAEVEKGEGTFVWGYFDTFIERLREHGLKAVVVLGGGHPRYTGFMEAPEGNIDQTDTYLLAPATPKAIEKFAAYTAATVKHFGHEGIVWELWNEPDSDRFWAPHAKAEDYIAVATAACQAMRVADPKAHIVGPGMADMPGRWGTLRAGFLGKVLRSSLPDCLDAISLHPYRDGEKPPETVLEAHEKLKTFIRAYTPKEKPTLPVITTEWGFTLTDTSETEQAAFLLRSFLLGTMAKVPLSIWYEWRDARSGPDDPEAHFGLLRLNRQEKQAYRVLESFLPPLVGSRIEERVNTPREEDFILRLRNEKGQNFIVFWTIDDAKPAKVSLQAPGKSAQIYQMTSMPQRIDCGDKIPSVRVLDEKGE
ncbi:MAG: cellulase family glycosylhydrolase [Bdellovibrionales bacterium]